MKRHIRHLVVKPGAANGPPRYYWQPSAELRSCGWTSQRLPKDRSGIVDLAELQKRAIAEAERYNMLVDHQRLRGAVVAAPAHTIDELIRHYSSSSFFTRLRPVTQRGYVQCMRLIESWAGKAPVGAVDWPRIEELSQSMDDRPSYRNATLRILRLLLNYSMRIGWTATNPGLRPLPDMPEHSGLIWPPEAIAAFVAAADRRGRWSIGTAVAVNEWIGQRQGDVLRLTRGVYIDGAFLIKQSKTGAKVKLPVDRVPQVRLRLEQEMARIDARFAGAAPRPAQLIINESSGQAYSGDSFRHLFAEIRAEVAQAIPSFAIDYILPGWSPDEPAACRVPTIDLQFMHLRHTAVCRMATAGCEIPLIAAVTGHSLRSVDEVLAHYLVHSERQAALAFDKRLAAERSPPAPHSRLRRLLSVVSGGGAG